MKNIRIVIAADSVSSLAFIRNILEGSGFEVVGDAGSLEEVKKVVAEQKPDLVTMDITLPGTDDLECTRAIRQIDKSMKVIVISSMMDDEIAKKAKRNKVSAYIHKPVDADELIAAVKSLLDKDELYRLLQEEFIPVFKEALMDGVNQMTKTPFPYREEYPSEKEYQSARVTVVIGIIGVFSGRMLLDFSKETAHKLTTAIFRREPKSNDEVATALGEFGNIAAGYACSSLNRKNQALGLRVAPPSVLSGEDVIISAPKYKTTTVLAQTDFGEFLMNAGFTKGEDEWM